MPSIVIIGSQTPLGEELLHQLGGDKAITYRLKVYAPIKGSTEDRLQSIAFASSNPELAISKGGIDLQHVKMDTQDYTSVETSIMSGHCDAVLDVEDPTWSMARASVQGLGNCGPGREYIGFVYTNSKDDSPNPNQSHAPNGHVLRLSDQVINSLSLASRVKSNVEATLKLARQFGVRVFIIAFPQALDKTQEGVPTGHDLLKQEARKLVEHFDRNEWV